MVNEIQPVPLFINKSRSKMRIHLPACAMRIMRRIRIGIKLCEKFLYGHSACCKCKSLIAVVTRIEIARPEKFGHSHLRHFLSVAEYSEFCLAGKYFLPAQQAGLPALAGSSVILQHFFPKTLIGK